MAEESVTKKAIIETLRTLGYRVMNHNSGTKRNYTMGLGTGTPDLYVPVRMSVSHPGITRDMKLIARAVWLEVKSKTGTPSKVQKDWIRAANDNGEFACVVRSVNEALDAVKRAANGERGPDPEVA